MKWWNKISVKISLAIFLVAVVPLSVFGVMTITKIRSALLASVSQTNGAAARKAANLVENTANRTIEDIRLILDNSGFEKQALYDREWTLQLLLKSFPHIFSVTVTDILGTPVLKVTREDTVFPQGSKKRNDVKAGFQGGQLNDNFNDLIRTGNGVLLLPIDLFFASPVAAAYSYALTLEINMNQLLEKVAEQHIINSGYLYILDKHGEIVLHPDKSVALSGEKAIYNPNVNLFMSGRTVPASLSRHMNRNNIPVVSNAYPTKAPRLLVVVEQLASEAMRSIDLIIRWLMLLMGAVVLSSILLSFYFVFKLSRPIKRLEDGVAHIGTGNMDVSIPVVSSDEIGKVTQAFNDMTDSLRRVQKKDADLLWIEQGLSRLEIILRNDQADQDQNLINFLCGYVHSHIGLLYVDTGGEVFELAAGYAVPPGREMIRRFRFGEGLIGQCAAEKKIRYLNAFPEQFFIISSALGQQPPKQSAVVPLIFNGSVQGVLELGTLNSFTATEKQFLKDAAERIGVALNAARSRQALNNLLDQTRIQKEALETQQTELQAANEELEAQTQRLCASEDQLKQQQEELQASNEELEEKTQFLERSRTQMEEKNRTLEQMQAELTRKAEDLAMSSKYKSEFLANMSHELRTPLNSLLLLAKILSENKENNLTEDQVASANVIFSSGSDLLSLINEILDLSRIEAEKMELNPCKFDISELARNIEATFSHLAQEKGLALNIAVDRECPAFMVSDFERVKQVLKNLIANAVKFTSTGGIDLRFYRPRKVPEGSMADVNPADVVAVSVKDTGIGIAEDKQSLIFEAFQQSEGGVSRRYGGTGLGLSICRELSKLLGGHIHLESMKGKGSTFTFYLPVQRQTPELEGKLECVEEHHFTDPAVLVQSVLEKAPVQNEPEEHLPDDRNKITPGKKSVLIIEDDIKFGKTLMDFCRKRGFLCLYSATGENGLSLARKYKPKAVILDIRLPGIDGWAVFDTLKADAATRHIPVHFMSVETPVFNVLNKGAIGFLAKPVSPDDLEKAVDKIEAVITKKVKSVLIVEDNQDLRAGIATLVKGRDIRIDEVASGKSAIAAVASKTYDCMILDLGLPDMTGFELLEALKKNPEITLPPIIVYTGRDLSFDEENTLRRYSESIIVKGVKSEERLLDETSLFLHRMVNEMPGDKKQMITDIHDSDLMFNGKKILLVDDDMRNVFALSKVLVQRKMTVLKAENGKKALDIIQQSPDIDLVLMDIMMPVMNGLETMRAIRKNRQLSHLPIIALTAKAMKQDRVNCIESGANDYLTKPVDIDRLLSMMRVWLYE